MPIKNTATTRQLLDSFDPKGESYGLDIIRRTGLASGTVYPILRRLEGEGIVTSCWEDIDSTVEMRPPRRLYRITPHGLRVRTMLQSEIRRRKKGAGSKERRGQALRRETL